MDDGPRPVTLLICDDHRVLTDALAIVVGLDGGLELVAPPVQDPQSAIDLCAEFLPDVVLMDVDLKSDMSGIDATRAIKENSPATKVIIMTAHDDDRLLVDAVEAGASGFLSKDDAAQEVLAAVKAAADGEVLIDPARSPGCSLRSPGSASMKRDALALLDDLTEREREIFSLLAQGHAERRHRLRSCTSARRPCRRTSATSWASSACTRSSRRSRSPSVTARSPSSASVVVIRGLFSYAFRPPCWSERATARSRRRGNPARPAAEPTNAARGCVLHTSRTVAVAVRRTLPPTEMPCSAFKTAVPAPETIPGPKRATAEGRGRYEEVWHGQDPPHEPGAEDAPVAASGRRDRAPWPASARSPRSRRRPSNDRQHLQRRDGRRSPTTTPDAAMYQITAATPGVAVVRCIQVTYTGSLHSTCRLYATRPSTRFGQFVTSSIDKGTVPARPRSRTAPASRLTRAQRVHGDARRASPRRNTNFATGSVAAPGAQTAWNQNDMLRLPVHADAAERPGRHRPDVRRHSFTWEAQNV